MRPSIPAPRSTMEFTWKDEPTAPTLAPGATILTSFPSAGLATTVAGHYIVRALKLARIARFESTEMPPIAVIQNGIVHPPIRVYGRSDFALVLSEFPPTPAQAVALARTLLQEATARRARWLLALEGVAPHPAGADDAPEDLEMKVWSIAVPPGSPMTQLLVTAGAESLEEGVLGGVSGSLLVQALGRPLPVGVLLATAHATEEFPDHRAGAALIETLDRVLPELKIDTGPLRAQAEEIEKALRAVMKSHPGHGASPSAPAGETAASDPSQMYQ